MLSPELVSGIRRVKEYRKLARHVGNWLSPQSANSSPWGPLLKHFGATAAIVSLLPDCGLRRSEVVALTFGDIQKRGDHWAIVDLVGKTGHVRTVPLLANDSSASSVFSGISRYRTCSGNVKPRGANGCAHAHKVNRRQLKELTGLPVLESQLQSQLSQSATWGRDQPANATGAPRKDVERGSIKMRRVQEIKNLPPQLQIDPLGWFEDFLRGKINIGKPRPNNGVSSQVAKGPCHRPRKSTGIVP